MQGGDIAAVLAAGLPEAAGTFAFYGASGAKNITGAFAVESSFSSYSHSNTSGNTSNVVSFSANRSNQIYGNSTTVQPPALQLIPQIKF